MNVSKNNVILAVAGAGKTTELTKTALKKTETTKRKLILSYTNNGLSCIKEKIIENNNGVLSENIEIMSWSKFLLNECLKPYQKDFIDNLSIKGLVFLEEVPKNAKGLPLYVFKKKSDVERYVTTNKNLYYDNMAELIVEISKKNNDLFINRLEDIYSEIYIDEVQDLNGEDLEIIEKLLSSKIIITLIGDHRQATFNTHSSQKFKKYNGKNIKLLFQEWKNRNLVNISELLECHRSIADICKFADMLYPLESKSKSLNTTETNLDGIYFICEKEVPKYIEKFNPFLLRYNKRCNTLNYPAINFGDSKALTKERILIFGTKPFLDFYLNNKPITSDPSKYYVAVTRARQSVCIVVPKKLSKPFLEDCSINEVNLQKYIFENEEQ